MEETIRFIQCVHKMVGNMVGNMLLRQQKFKIKIKKIIYENPLFISWQTGFSRKADI